MGRRMRQARERLTGLSGPAFDYRPPVFTHRRALKLRLSLSFSRAYLRPIRSVKSESLQESAGTKIR